MILRSVFSNFLNYRSIIFYLIVVHSILMNFTTKNFLFNFTTILSFDLIYPIHKVIIQNNLKMLYFKENSMILYGFIPLFPLKY
jgi:hypothetical protein